MGGCVRERKQSENTEFVQEKHSENLTLTLFQHKTANMMMMPATQQLVTEIITIGRIFRSSASSKVLMTAKVDM